jgi:hypothetical protein
MLNFFAILSSYFGKNVNNKVIYTLFYREQFKYLKTIHSYHLVDPSPWRAAVRCTKPFLTQRTHLKNRMFLLGKPPTRIFYFYINDCLKFACRKNLLNTAGHTGKRKKII